MCGGLQLVFNHVSGWGNLIPPEGGDTQTHQEPPRRTGWVKNRGDRMVDQFTEVKKTPQEEYLGLRREDISWAPIVDSVKCDAIACGQFCIRYCPFGVYELAKDGKKAVVKNPKNCMVGDEACRWRCQNEAVDFPSREALKAQLMSLRKKQAEGGRNREAGAG